MILFAPSLRGLRKRKISKQKRMWTKEGRWSEMVREREGDGD